MVDDLPADTAHGFELLASLTARLASTARLDEIVDTVLEQIVELGFGAVWMAVLDGVDTTHEMPKIFMLDMRQPIGRGFLERKMINIADPDGLYIIDRDPVGVGWCVRGVACGDRRAGPAAAGRPRRAVRAAR